MEIKIIEAEERGYLTLGDIRKLDLPDETPIFSNCEGGSFLASTVHKSFTNKEDIENDGELELEDEESKEYPIIGIYFE